MLSLWGVIEFINWARLSSNMYYDFRKQHLITIRHYLFQIEENEYEFRAERFISFSGFSLHISSHSQNIWIRINKSIQSYR